MIFTMTTINITQQIDINQNTVSQEPLRESNSGRSSPGTSGADTSGADTSGAGTSGAGTSGADTSGAGPAVCSTVKALPRQILSKNAICFYLKDIMESFEPEEYDKSTAKFRKPSYQRGIKKSAEWNSDLINSILEGKAIGGIVMSKWLRIVEKNGSSVVDEFYNIEDGGTRLGACKKFIDGECTSDYGDYKGDVKEKFDNYKVAVEMLEKSDNCENNDNYFKELCKNFSWLQEGTPLTANDRYAANSKDTTFNYSGSDIVNYTIALSKEQMFKDVFELGTVGSSATNRTKLAVAISIVSGAMWGPKYANIQYAKHIDILYNTISQAEKDKCIEVLTCIQNVKIQLLKDRPMGEKEKFKSNFNNTAKFVGSMIADLYDVRPDGLSESYKNEFETRWVKLINHWRSLEKTQAEEWLEKVVYNNLSVAHKRNSLEQDLYARMKAVKQWNAVV